jgi:histidinol-phosphate phosphatase family protein
MANTKAIFLDRDGTINIDKGYVYEVSDLKLLPGVVEGLNLLKNEYSLFIITNQSGIGKGYYSVKDFWRFNKRVTSQLRDHGIAIEKTYFCPHTKEDNCVCRKPKTKHIDDILNQYNLDLEKSWVIGDHPSDTVLGINAGCNTIYLLTGHGKKHLKELKTRDIQPTFIAHNFLEAARFINSYKK